MLLTITLILLAAIALAALEIRLFWWLGERDDRRRARERSTEDASNPQRGGPSNRVVRSRDGPQQGVEEPGRLRLAMDPPAPSV